jgi:hypothetical protein
VQITGERTGKGEYLRAATSFHNIRDYTVQSFGEVVSNVKFDSHLPLLEGCSRGPFSVVS